MYIQKLEELKLAVNPKLNAVGNIIDKTNGVHNGLNAKHVGDIVKLLLEADNIYLEAYDEGFEEGKESVKEDS